MKIRSRGYTYFSKRATSAGLLEELLLSFKPTKRGSYIDPDTLEMKNIEYKVLFRTIYVYRERVAR